MNNMNNSGYMQNNCLPNMKMNPMMQMNQNMNKLPNMNNMNNMNNINNMNNTPNQFNYYMMPSDSKKPNSQIFNTNTNNQNSYVQRKNSSTSNNFNDDRDERKSNTSSINGMIPNNMSNNGKYTCRFEIQIENDKEFQVARRLIGAKVSIYFKNIYIYFRGVI
jgi:hypothetical protein